MASYPASLARARADGTERTTRTMGRRSDANETTTPESAAAASAWKRHAEDAHRVSSAETLARMGVLDVAHGVEGLREFLLLFICESLVGPQRS